MIAGLGAPSPRVLGIVAATFFVLALVLRLNRSAGVATVTLRWGAISARANQRVLWLSGAVIAVCLGLMTVGLVVGDFPVPAGRALATALWDRGGEFDFVVNALRFPRVVVAVLAGACLAMALAQDARTMLLDEPTTFLDIAHQMETLDLLAELNESEGRTVVMVLHDLNQACRYAAHLIAMAEGRVTAAGRPSEVVTPDLIRRVFGLSAKVIDDPVTGTPLCLPLGRRRGIPGQ